MNGLRPQRVFRGPFTVGLGESLRIGEDVVIKVFVVSGEQTRLGITAPREVLVYRSELYLRIRKEGRKKMP
jgi:carbon storage regulator